MLVFEIRVSGDEHGEVLLLGRVQQLAVLQLRPAALIRGGNFVMRQCVTQGFGRALIEENTHLCGSKRTSSGVIEDGASLFQRDTREPFDKLGH